MSDPDSLEVAPGIVHRKIEGWIPELASDDNVRGALEEAFDYRGDVTVTLKDGTTLEGYVFDRRTGSSLNDSTIRLLPKDASGRKISVAYSEIAALTFSGRDTAAGKSWEAWLRKYWEKKAAGEKGIAIEPDTLD